MISLRQQKSEETGSVEVDKSTTKRSTEKVAEESSTSISLRCLRI